MKLLFKKRFPSAAEKELRAYQDWILRDVAMKADRYKREEEIEEGERRGSL